AEGEGELLVPGFEVDAAVVEVVEGVEPDLAEVQVADLLGPADGRRVAAAGGLRATARGRRRAPLGAASAAVGLATWARRPNRRLEGRPTEHPAGRAGHRRQRRSAPPGPSKSGCPCRTFGSVAGPESVRTQWKCGMLARSTASARSASESSARSPRDARPS